jgi:DNA-binding NarL/FixJ family response regulator
VAFRVLLVDDHRLVAECLQRLLQDSFEVVDWVPDAEAAIARSRLQVPDVIVISISVSGFSWLNTVRRLVEAIPLAKVLLVATEESPTHVRAAFREGAKGYVLMRSPVSELLAAIQTVMADGIYITSLIAATADGRLHGVYQLTQRQVTIMDLIVAGKTAKQIATLLQISEKTVQYHKTAMFRALRLRNSLELIRFACTDASMLRGAIALDACAPGR